MTDETQDANEILAAAREAKEQGEAASRTLSIRAKSWPLAKIGLAAGIGSAAIAGAVLFAGRDRKRK